MNKMSDVGRNRSEGWQHAKLTGHENEEKIAKLTMEDCEIQKRLLICAHLDPANVSIDNVAYGGLCESDVVSVFDDKTKSKTDMWLFLSNGKRLNVSIKKDTGGQVFLIGVERFINGFELQYKKTIPEKVKKAISLYFGSAKDTIDIINSYGVEKALETRKHRLVAETLKAYDESLAKILLDWFNENMYELFDFCFARGLAKNEEDWAQIVWYKNLVGENSFDTLLYLPDMKNIPKDAVYGSRNGGSTIQLPFGFVQWHSPRKVIPGNLQFHHSYEKMIDLSKLCK